MLNHSNLKNPVWKRSDNLRDPSVYKTDEGYLLFYSRFSNKSWNNDENWSVACVFTKDFIIFEEDRDITPKGFASPGDLIFWKGRYILPMQSYPSRPTMLCFIESRNLKEWTAPRFFLKETLDLPWNLEKRAIDPTFVLCDDMLHCFFVGSDDKNYSGHANLIGHAVTQDPTLERWEILSKSKPLIGCSEDSPDGVENITVFKNPDDWIMIYSEGLRNQHLAYAKSQDLYHWVLMGSIYIPRQKWFSQKYGAPYVWKEGDLWIMILMGQGDDDKTTFGLLTSQDGVIWNPLDE